MGGCGCDKDKVTKCTAKDCPDWTKCIKDADCCTYEEDGMKVKDSADLMCAITALGGDTSKNHCMRSPSHKPVSEWPLPHFASFNGRRLFFLCLGCVEVCHGLVLCLTDLSVAFDDFGAASGDSQTMAMQVSLFKQPSMCSDNYSRGR